MGSGVTRVVGAALAVGAAWLLAPACGGSTRSDGTAATPDCAAGSEGCSCRADGGCDEGLTCTSGVCVEGTEDAGQEQSEDAGEVTEHPCPELAELAESLFSNGACGWQAEESQYLDTNLLLVVDGSASLGEEVAEADLARWELLRFALAEALMEPSAAYEIGLLLVPDTEGLPAICDGAPEQCCEVGASGALTIPIGPGEETFPEIVSALEARSPAGASPLAAALERAYEHLVDGNLSGGRFVLLASDGGANCNQQLDCADAQCTLQLDPGEGCLAVSNTCCRAGPGGCLDDAEVTAQIERLFQAGVHTIVVGVAGNEQYAAALDRWAEAGDFERPDGTAGYFEVSVEAELTALVHSFRSVSTQLVVSCEVHLDDPPPNPNEAFVAVDCEPIPHDESGEGDSESWWVFNNADPDLATSIILAGAVCERVQTEGIWRVDVALGCPDFGD